MVGIHQIPVNARRRIIRVARRLLGLQLCDARLQLLVIGHQRLVSRRVHVVAVMICPPGPVIDGAVQQPPPEQAVVGILVGHPGPRRVGIEDIIDPHWSARKRYGVRHIYHAPVRIAGGHPDWRRLDAVGRRARGGARGLARRGRDRKLRIPELRELRFAGFLLSGMRGSVVKGKPAAARIRAGVARRASFPDAAVTVGSGGKSVGCGGAVTFGGSVAVPATVAPSGTGTITLATAGTEVLDAAVARTGLLARAGPVARASAST